MAGDLETTLNELVGTKPVRVVDVYQDSAMVGGAYEGASQFDNAFATWQPPLLHADGEILPDKPYLDARVNDSIRNDAYVSSGAELAKDGVVGHHFTLSAKPNTRILGLDEGWATEFQEEVEAKFELYAESLAHWVDAGRSMTLTEMVRIAVGAVMAGGETLASVEYIREDDRPFRTAIQLLDPARLDTPPDMMNTPRVRGGVERDRRGKPLAYHIRDAHPAEWDRIERMQFRRIPARKPWGRAQFIHIIERMRPDQSRGVARMTAALKELRITKKFRDVTLQNAVTQASYAAAIESELPTETVFQMIGGGEEPAKALTNYVGSYLDVLDKYTGGAKNMVMNGVKIQHLFPGTKLNLMPASQGGALGTEFESSLLRYIAAALGVSYEELSKDYSKSNYSSARFATVETQKAMRSKKRFIAERFASIVYRLWFEEAVNRGMLETVSMREPNIYDGLNFDAYTSCQWIGASTGQVDELKETQAAFLRIKAGISTREREIARLGEDWRRVFEQLEREEGEAENRGLVFADSTEMMNAASGTPTETPAQSDDGGGDD